MRKLYLTITAIFFSLILILPVHAAQVYSDGFFQYHAYEGYNSICGYFGSESTVTVPSSIAGSPVSRIEAGAFDECSTIEKLVLPDTIMEIEDGAFSGAKNLKTIEDASGVWNGKQTEDGAGNSASDRNEAETGNHPKNVNTEIGDYEYTELEDEEETADSKIDNSKKNDRNETEIIRDSSDNVESQSKGGVSWIIPWIILAVVAIVTVVVVRRKKKRGKKAACILLALIMICSAVSNPATLQAKTAVPGNDAWDGDPPMGPKYPFIEAADYDSITAIGELEQGEERFRIPVIVAGETRVLNLEFPADGGFRLHTGKQGFFEPTERKRIQYEKHSEEELVMKPVDGDGTQVIFKGDSNRFVLEIYNRDGKCVVPIASEGIRFGYTDGNRSRISLSLPLEEKEAVYGSGERFNELNQVGKRLQMWNLDAGYMGTNWENNEFWRGYKNVPILHSSRGYTVFSNTFYGGTADIGYTDDTICTLEFVENDFDFFFWTGTVRENLADYTELTGKTILLPKWAYSYSAGGGKDVWNNYAGNLYNTAQKVIDEYKKLGTPNLAAIYIEAITEENTNVYQLFQNAGMRMLKWNSPNMSQNEMKTHLKDVAQEDLPIVVEQGTTNPYGENKETGEVFIDFTRDNATELLTNYLNSQRKWGVRGGLIDFGELIGSWAYFNGNQKSWQEMHNFFAYWYARRYNEAMVKLDEGDGSVFFSRAGCAGTQAYTAFFTGDQQACIGGLEKQLIAGLSASASGLTMWGGDLAGYEGTPDQDTFARGMQFSAFQPIMRSHGTTSRFPWDYGELGKRTYQTHYWLRENLLNKIYSEAVNAHKTGQAMTEPLTMVYPEDVSLREVYDTYLFCQDLLVAPALEENVYLYDVTFPEGSWYSLWDGRRVSGGGTQKAEAPADKSPVYVKAGAVIPVTVAPSLTLTDSMQDQERTEALLVTLPDDNRETTYWKDENTAVSYQNTIVNDSSFKITAGAGNEAKAILVKGSAACGVQVDGQELQRLSQRPTASSDAGYFCEDNSETVIYLGRSDWSEVTVSVGRMDVPNVMLLADASSEAKKATDGDYNTFSKAATMTYDLGQVRSLKNLVVKWTRNSADHYKIETSKDNLSWTTIADETNAYGAIGDYSLDGKEVRYVRISGISSASGTVPELYEIEAYEQVEAVKLRHVWSMSEEYTAFASYYSDYIKAGDNKAMDLELASVNEHWTIKDGTFTRKSTVQDVENGDVRDCYSMAELFLKDRKYTDFELNVDVSVGTNSWKRAFVGFGAKLGRHVQQSGGGTMVFLESNRLRYGGWTGSGYEEGKDGLSHKLWEDYYENRPIHLRLVVQDKKATVYVGNSEEGTTFDLPADYDGGYIYLASNTSGASYSNLRIEELKGIDLYGHSLTLGGEIGTNFYLQLSDEVAADTGAYVQMSIPGKTTTVTKISEAETKIEDGNTLYRFTYKVAAKEMTDVITTEFYSGNGTLLRTFRYSVSDYADYVVNHSEKFSSKPELVALSKALLNYGSSAQTFFGYYTDRLANEGMQDEDKVIADVDESKLTKPVVSMSDGFSGLTYYGSSLVLENTTELRLFFQREFGRDISDYKVNIITPDGITTQETFALRGNLYCVAIPNIPAQDLGAQYKIVVTCGDESMTVICAALDYVGTVLNSTSSTDQSEQVDVAKALYWYWDAAKKYFK